MNQVEQSSFRYLDFYLLGILVLVAGFFAQDGASILQGLWQITLSPSQLISDYMLIGGVGAAFVNSALVYLMMVALAHYLKSELTGILIAGLLTVLGFGFFGKHILNSIPLIMGVYLYTKYQGIPFSQQVHVACFVTGISPAVSYIALGLEWPLWISIPAAILVGVLIGMIVIPLAGHMLNFHKGYNLYNIGFTIGVIGLALRGALRMFDLPVDSVSHLYLENDTIATTFVAILGLFLTVYGLVVNRGWRGYRELLTRTGKTSSDYVQDYGKGIVLINMGFLAWLCLAYVKINGGIINGPLIGGILTVIAFGAFGKHPKNCLPIFLGVMMISMLNMYGTSNTTSLLIGLFGTTIAPISGEYGFMVGILAGMLHKAIASNVGIVHGGLNLYNNGFAGGFVASLMVPLLQTFLPRDGQNE